MNQIDSVNAMAQARRLRTEALALYLKQFRHWLRARHHRRTQGAANKVLKAV